MNEFTVYNDTDVLEVIEKINSLIQSHGLEIVDDNQEHDGYCVYHLEKRDKSNEG